MTFKHPEILSNAPYYDDFDDAKNFLRTLFKPGYAVQARELTQLQTVLQNQIARFADHIFLDGSQVFGGKTFVNNTNYVRIEETLRSANGTAIANSSSQNYLASLVTEDADEVVTNEDTYQSNRLMGTIAKTELEIYKFTNGSYATTSSGTILVNHYVDSLDNGTDDYPVLFFADITGNDGISPNDILKIKGQEIRFKVINQSLTVEDSIYPISPTGKATLVKVDAGIYYVDGMFVKNKAQILVPYELSVAGQAEESYTSGDYDYQNGGSKISGDVRLFSAPSVRVGLYLNRSIVTVDEDQTLRDPSSGIYNANAPGADRYKISLDIKQYPYDPQDLSVSNYASQDFIQIARIVKGKLDWIRVLPNYSQILDLFARRTYDESGSYTVSPFGLEVKNHLREDLYIYEAQSSSDDTANLGYLDIGGYIWVGSETIDPTQANFNFANASFAIGQIVSVIPYKEALIGSASQTPTSSSKLVYVKMKNSKRLSISSSTFASVQYRRASDYEQTSVQLKFKNFTIDSDGTYSVFDLPQGNSSLLNLAVQPGKAYVFGYETELLNVKNVNYDRGLEILTNTKTEDVNLNSSSILGNYLVCNFANDQQSIRPDWESLPKMELQTQDIFTLVMEQKNLVQKSSPVLSWAPYKEWSSSSTEYMKGLPTGFSQEKYESVVFVSNTGLSTELNSEYYISGGSDTGQCNNRQSPYNNVGGSSTLNSYEFRLISAVKNNVKKASFLQQVIEGNFSQAYSPVLFSGGTPVPSDSVGFVNSYGANTDYDVKQLNSAGVVTATGDILRWVPSTNFENEATLYLQSTDTFVSPYNDQGDYVQLSAPNAGVLFSPHDNVSWGSSIKAVMNIDKIYRITTTPVPGIQTPATGELEGIQIKGTAITGYIFRTEATANQIVFYVQLNNNPNGSLTDEELISTKLINGSPCFEYTIIEGTRLDTASGERYLRIEFNDKNNKTQFNNSASTPPEREVYQYRWDSITGIQADKSVGVLYAWVANQKALYIKECDTTEPFNTKYGPVYQPLAAAVWGNEGFTPNTDFTGRIGRFVNIKHNDLNNYSDGKDFQEEENLIQTLSAQTTYDRSYNYLVGEKIFQIQQPDTDTEEYDDSIPYEYSSATVLSWSYPDINNPADTSPMILVARIDKYGPDQPGSYGSTTLPYQLLNTFTVGAEGVSSYGFSGKIVPYRVLLTNPNTWPYAVTDSSSVYFTDNKESRQQKSTTPLDSVIGTTRVRAVTPYAGIQSGETGPLFKFFIFDTELTEIDSSFNNVSSLVYSQEVNGTYTKKKVATIAPFSGKKKRVESFPGTTQTIDVYDTVIFEPGKDKNIFKLPSGSVFNNVIQDDSLTIEVQKIYNTEFGGSTPTVEVQIGESDSVFLTSDANINWFVVNSDTGVRYTLLNDQTPSSGQLSYVTDGDTLTLTRPNSTTGEEITIFAKIARTFNSNSVKNKKEGTKKETVSGLKLETKGKHKGKYVAELNPQGFIKNLKSIYSVVNGSLVTGTSRLDEYFKLDLGMTDQKVVKPKLVLNPGHTNPDGTLKGEIFSASSTGLDPASVTLEVFYDYYTTSSLSSSGIFTKESFKNVNNQPLSIDQIPFYVSPNDGEIYHETSIIDFRPNSLNLSSDFTLQGKIIPHPDWSDSINVQYFLPRRDKLVLNAKGNFEVLYGTPSMNPVLPQDKPQAMTIYLLEKPDYVFKPSDVGMKMLDNRRYTMRDIGKIDSRVKKLEYYTTLSLLEKSAEDLLVLDANGNNRFKSGILVDTFNGHKIGDVLNPDYNIAMDFSEGYARPPFKTNTTDLEEIPNSQPENSKFKNVKDNGFISETQRSKIKDNIYMFPYTREVFIAQPLATRSISVQPHEVTTFEGIANVFPPMDNWVDTETRPAVRVNLAGENDAWDMMVASFNNNNLAPFGTQWNEWQTLSSVGISSNRTTEVVDRREIRRGGRIAPTGISVDRQVGGGLRFVDQAITTLTTVTTNELLTQERTGFRNILSTSTSDVSLGDRIVDVSIQPFMRESVLRVWGTGLKPSSKMYVFFDGVNVAEYCYKYNTFSDLFNDIGGSTPTSYHFATSDISNLKTDENGAAFIEFRLPGGTFRTGDRKFEITDDPRNNRDKASSYASVVYSASGLRTVSEETIATTRNFETTRTELESQQRTIENTTVQTSTSTEVLRTWFDPLAQTFFVDPASHPEGIFLESVDLFFARAPEANIPVHIQVRPTVNGYPDSTKIYPGGIVFKERSEVIVTDNPQAGSNHTRFTFSKPLHLAPGEHSIVVKSPSSEYEVYIATLGDFILGTDQKVTNQPYVGVFFTSANASTWSADQNTDIMMVMNKCVFATNTVYDMKIRNVETQEQVIYETVNVVGSYVDFASCRTQWEFIATPLTSNEEAVNVIEPNENFELPVTCVYGQNTNKTARIELSASTTNRDVSPVIDLDVMDLFTVRNLIESDDTINNGETNPYASAIQSSTIARARYISRVVTLEDGFESNNLSCILTVNKPQGTNIQVFGKVQDAFSTAEFHQAPYIKMKANVSDFDNYSTEDEYVEVEFALPQDTSSPFNRFCIKICLYSTNPAFVPKIKDMRALAVL